MDDQRPQEPDSEVPNDRQLEEELDQVLSAASSMVDTLAEEVGTSDESTSEVESSPPAGIASDEEPDFMAELTQSAGPAAESSGPQSDPIPDANHLGAGSSAVASPENLGVIGSVDLGVIGTTATASQTDDLQGDLETIDATETVAVSSETTSDRPNGFVQRVVSIVASLGVCLLSLIAPLLEILDRPLSGVSQPIRNAMGALAIATLATAMLVFAISFW